MVKCKLCRKNEAKVRIDYARFNLCSDCFIKFFHKRVKETVEKYKMFTPDDVVGVAVSGGKDSTTLLHSLKQIFPEQDIKALHINLGIKGYSEISENVVRELTKTLGVDLIVYDLKKEEGFTIDDFENTFYRRKICSVCGTMKRYLFNYVAFKYDIDVLATGHTLDDMVRTLFSVFMAGDFSQLVRIKPVLLPTHPKLKKKVKPLFRIPEEENIHYVKFNNLLFTDVKSHHDMVCPSTLKSEIMEFIKDNRRKYQLLSVFMRLIPLIEEKIPKVKLRECKLCGFPSTGEICARCKRILLLKGKA
jgi:uncharacterized protein (TIGR00269 family)